MPRLIGIRHDVIMKNEVMYLVFYDIDKPITQNELDKLDDAMQEHKISYLLIKTKHGHHLIGLTPVDSYRWGYIFAHLKEMFNGYYGGIVIRLSLKEDEKQELLVKNTSYGEVIPNLYNLYAKRFNYDKLMWNKEFSKHLLVFEKYRTENK